MLDNFYFYVKCQTIFTFTCKKKKKKHEKHKNVKQANKNKKSAFYAHNND